MKKSKNHKSENKKNLPKKLLIYMITVVILFIALLGRIAWLQFVNGAYLKEMAIKQQTTNRIISPKRGTIYDSNGKALALSAQVDTITINPEKFIVKDDKEKTQKLQEKITQAFSEIFELDYNEVYSKVTSNSKYETIIKKVEEEKVNKLKTWMKDNDTYAGINIDPDTKRYYPYNNLASSLLGFCGGDNQGLSGLEYYWDTTLTGTPGKISTIQDASQDVISNKNEQYIAPENGSDITLTIDLNIQTIAEKYLQQAVKENNCKRGGNLIIMNPNNGDILAMSTYPDYNLNTPFEPNEALVKEWSNLSNSAKSNALQEMWKNKAVSNTYEPGSTFKLLIASAALEEDLVETDISHDFYCNGKEDVSGTIISCANTAGHGHQTLREALENSCNPAFIQLGKRIGASFLYKYFDAFGLFDKTGIQTAGEVTGIFHNLDKIGPVELATISFGQRFTVTPLQLITSVSAIANNGYLMTPRIVKSVKNTDTNNITTIEPKVIRQVISAETSEKMKDMMKSVVVDGGGKYGQVTGYSVGGKTGTSEPIAGKEEEGYVSSFIAVAPVENTEVVVLLTLYDPPEKNHFGSKIAAPVVSQILSEILPYLDIPSNISTTTQTTDSSTSTILLPSITGKTASEAKKILENSGFKCSFSSSNDSIITEQVPKSGTCLLKNSIVKLYSDETTAKVSVTVPNLKGLTYLQAKNSLSAKNLNIKIVGTGKVVSQDVTAESFVEEGTVVTVNLAEELGTTAR